MTANSGYGFKFGLHPISCRASWQVPRDRETRLRGQGSTSTLYNDELGGPAWSQQAWRVIMGKATAGPIRIFSTDTDSGTVTIVERDGVAFRHVATVGVGNAPRGAVKFTADGRGFVSNCGGDTISEIDAFTGRETGRIRVGPAPRGIGILPGDRYALVSSSGEGQSSRALRRSTPSRPSSGPGSSGCGIRSRAS